jgi:hypothetical protein
MIHLEEWVEIEDFPGYIISNLGNIQHKDRPNTNRKVGINHQGFPTIVLFRGQTRYVRHVNKLVAQAFLEPPQYRDMIAIWHIDGDLLNCQADNLLWDRRDRVLEWNEMHRSGQPRYRTKNVMDNATGRVYTSAYECGMHVGELETAIITHIDSFPDEYADRGKFRYVG